MQETAAAVCVLLSLYETHAMRSVSAGGRPEVQVLTRTERADIPAAAAQQQIFASVNPFLLHTRRLLAWCSSCAAQILKREWNEGDAAKRISFAGAIAPFGARARKKSPQHRSQRTAYAGWKKRFSYHARLLFWNCGGFLPLLPPALRMPILYVRRSVPGLNEKWQKKFSFFLCEAR